MKRGGAGEGERGVVPLKVEYGWIQRCQQGNRGLRGVEERGGTGLEWEGGLIGYMPVSLGSLRTGTGSVCVSVGGGGDGRVSCGNQPALF